MKAKYYYGLSILTADILKIEDIEVKFKHYLNGWQATFTFNKGENKYWVSVINHDVSNGLEVLIEKNDKHFEQYEYRSEEEVIEIIQSIHTLIKGGKCKKQITTV